MTIAAPARRPRIVLCETDRRLLEGAALDAILSAPREAGALLDEVDRAEVVPDEELAWDVVRLGSEVDYVDGLTGAVRRARVVMDPSSDVTGGCVSPLMGVGAALLGLRAGDSIVWQDRLGSESMLTVLRTTPP